MIRGAYSQVNNLIVQFTTARGAAQRVFEMLDALPDVDLNAGIKLRREDVRGEFELTNVEFAYQMRPKEKVIDGINLTIAGGSTIAFVGKSGGGKSTMIHLLMRFYDPTAGTIKLDGRDLTTVNLRSLHELTGLVAQDTQLFGESQVPSSGPSTNSLCFQTESVQLSCCAAQATTSKRTSLMAWKRTTTQRNSSRLPASARTRGSSSKSSRMGFRHALARRVCA